MASQNQPPPAAWLAIKPYLNGGLSGMCATMAIQPVDMVKVRLQMGDPPGGPLTVARTLVRQNGFSYLYRGLSAGLLRQATYTTARLGVYSQLYEAARDRRPAGGPPPLWQKAMLGLAAGGAGAAVGTPADLALVRMQADSALPAAQRRNYRGVFDALARVAREEGWRGLFTGAGPTMVRAMAANMGLLATNDQAKEVLQDLGYAAGSPVVTFGGATLAGLAAAVCSLPFDYIKTQMQRQKVDAATGQLTYASGVDCALSTLRQHGPLRFYAGFPTYCVRVAPHVSMTLVVLAWLPRLQAPLGL